MLVTKAQPEHVLQIHAIEVESFSDPWSIISINYEIENSIFLVAIDAKKVIGYVSMRKILDEGHINNIAVTKAYRSRGVGSMLISELINLKRSITALTLEVRVSNQAAINLYQKHGFKIEGYRKDYYRDPIEDAAIMWRFK